MTGGANPFAPRGPLDAGDPFAPGNALGGRCAAPVMLHAPCPPAGLAALLSVATMRKRDAVIGVEDALNELRVASARLRDVRQRMADHDIPDPDAGEQSCPALTPAGSPGDGHIIAGAGGGGFSTLFASPPPASRILDLPFHVPPGRLLTAGGFTLPAVRSLKACMCYHCHTVRWSTS